MVGQWNKSLFIFVFKTSHWKTELVRAEVFISCRVLLFHLIKTTSVWIKSQRVHSCLHDVDDVLDMQLVESQAVFSILPNLAHVCNLVVQYSLRAFLSQTFFCAVDVNLPQGSLKLSSKHN